MRIIIAVVVLLATVVFAIPSSSPLYGDDCSLWCLSGSTVLQSEIFGTTNQWCQDERGCVFTWNASIVPCSASLLSFSAHVGAGRVSFDTLDSATSATLAFVCSESDVGATLELRAPGELPIMTWRYRSVGLTCARLLGDLRDAESAFISSEVAITLAGTQVWFSSGGEPISSAETECTRPAGSQCFRGADDLILSSLGWADACGPAATSCQTMWQFCLDAFTGKSIRASMQVGSLPLKSIAPMSARTLVATCEDPTQRNPSTTAVVLSDGSTGQVLARWAYRAAPCAAMFYSPRRHSLFVSRTLSVSRQTVNGSLTTASMIPSTTGGLDERVWRGAFIDGTGDVRTEEATVADKNLVITWLSIGLGAAGLLCIAGWVVAVGLLWGKYHNSIGKLPFPFVNDQIDAPAPKADKSYLYTTLEEQRAAGKLLPTVTDAQL